eukprot:364349-Chlamydomonas_euryale.AAC.11
MRTARHATFKFAADSAMQPLCPRCPALLGAPCREEFSQQGVRQGMRTKGCLQEVWSCLLRVPTPGCPGRRRGRSCGIWSAPPGSNCESRGACTHLAARVEEKVGAAAAGQPPRDHRWHLKAAARRLRLQPALAA